MMRNGRKKGNVFGKRLLSVCVLLSVMLIAPWADAYVLGVTGGSLPHYSFYIGTNQYFPLIRSCRDKGIECRWDDLTRKIYLYKDNSKATLIVDEPVAEVNGVIKRLDAPPRIFNGAPVLPAEILDPAWWQVKPAPGLLPVLPQRYLIDRVIIDAGHGGKDPGAMRAGIMEKDIVLDVSQRLRDKLKRRGIDVIMTRDADHFVTLSRRSRIANMSDGDLFISIHANASPNSSANGFEIYYLSEAVDDRMRAVEMLENSAWDYESDPESVHKMTDDPTLWDIVFSENRKESIELASAVLKSMNKLGAFRNRGLKTANFRVLHWSDKPSILIELGFISNSRDRHKLVNPLYKSFLAEHISRGIMDFKGKYERTNGFTK